MEHRAGVAVRPRLSLPASEWMLVDDVRPEARTDTFPEVAGALDRPRRRRFRELLAYNLTVACRAVGTDDMLTDGEKLQGMKALSR